jgi:hypothetical protein
MLGAEPLGTLALGTYRYVPPTVRVYRGALSRSAVYKGVANDATLYKGALALF